ncbi:hypothetical protein TIFTF001_009384 [Ficus carica]|uniref:Uncharacterized protein n=1 Tax=Ficus carica TaxID=3494 RepID=A0AA88DHG2_FICCA|nr:hypothetical protein TIFTF001_009384 [Ficus carica]
MEVVYFVSLSLLKSLFLAHCPSQSFHGWKDNDSDLEYELEAVPLVNNESATEAAACVKVLIASGIPSGSNPSGSTIEAPLTINIPSGQPSRASEQPSCSTQGTNIVVPVSVQKQPAPAPTVAENLDTNGTAGGKRKRKPWSEAEDLELIAAVQKCGEGNWANILRGDFKGDRTASQLSQAMCLYLFYSTRWAIIRKRHGNLNLGGNLNGAHTAQLSEAQLAARHAMSLALNMPVKNLTAGTTAVNNSAGANSTNKSAGTNATNKSLLTPAAAVEASTSGNSSLQSQKQSHENLASKQPPVGSLGPTTKSRLPMKKPVVKSIPSSDAMVRATAVAAGARIASPSDAASLLRAAQAKNAIHIKPTGGVSIMSSMPSGMPAHSEAHPNVHYIRTGLAPSPVSNYAAATPSAPSPGSIKAISPPVQQTQTSNGTSGTSLDVSSKQKNVVSCTPARELPLKQEPKTIEEIKVYSGSATKEQIQGDGAFFSANSQGELVQEGAPDPDADLRGTPATGKPVSSSSETMGEHDQVTIDIQPKDNETENAKEILSSPVGAGENREQNVDKMQEDDAVGESREPQNMDKMHEDHAVEENGEAQRTDKMQEDHAAEENGEARDTDKMLDDHAVEGNGEARDTDKMLDDHAVEGNDKARNVNKMEEDHAVEENGEAQKTNEMQEDHAVEENGEAQNTNKMQENHAVEENSEAQNIDKMQEDLSSTRADGCSAKSENSSKETGNEM